MSTEKDLCMNICFWYKAKHRILTYFFVAIFLILPIYAANLISYVQEVPLNQKLAYWPMAWEFFIEMFLAIEVSWEILADILNGTYKNMLSAGIGKRKFFFQNLLNVGILATGELITSTIIFYAVLWKGRDLYFGLSVTDERALFIYLVLMWCRHIALVFFCVVICLLVRKLSALFTCVISTFMVMFFDSVASMSGKTNFLTKLINYLPIGTAKAMRDAIFEGRFIASEAIIDTLPTIAITLVIVLGGELIFSMSEMN